MYNSVVTNEAFSDVSIFMKDPKKYLDYQLLTMQKENPKYDLGFSGILDSDGDIFSSLSKMKKELISVGAYDTAIAIYKKMDNVLKNLYDKVDKDDIESLTYTHNIVKMDILSIIKERDEYLSKKASVVSRYMEVLNV